MFFALPWLVKLGIWSWMVAVLAALSFPLQGCGASWPEVKAVGDPAFVGKRRGIQTVDVLPIDIQVMAHPGEKRSPTDLYAQLDGMVRADLVPALARRGYSVVANMDWSGVYVAHDGSLVQAMTAEETAATAYALSGYGSAQAQVKGELLVPHLPVRLGGETNADATLYVGGWAYAGKTGPSTGEKVLKGVVIGLIVVVAVVAIVAAAKGKGGGGGSGVGRIASGVGRAAAGTARVAGRVVGGIGRVAGHVGKVALRTAAETSLELTRGPIHGLDAMGRSHTHVEIYSGRPDYFEEGAPHKGPSRMMVEMTLVDNRTGRALWHARQEFRASPARHDQVARIVRDLVNTLPTALAPEPPALVGSVASATH